MSTFTIRVTSSATNTAGTAYGQQPDQGQPSFFDMHVTGSTDPLIPNGVYDAYCLNPLISITLSPTTYLAQEYAGNAVASFTPIGFNSLTQTQINQLNWLLAQNFTSDPKYAGQFNFGEVQTAIWKIVGFTDGQITSAGFGRFLNDNNRNVVNTADINFLVSASQAAVASNNGVLPTNAFFSAVIDPNGNVQPLIVQLQSAKLGNYVWLDSNANGIQDTGELGVDNVVVELYDSNGVLISSTLTGDDASTAAIEKGYYQFAGLSAGSYKVKFIAPSYQFTAQDKNSNSQDAVDSDADVTTGLSQLITLAAGASNQTIDAGLIVANAQISGYVYEDVGNDGVRNAEPAIAGVTITLTGTNDLGQAVSLTTTTDANGYYEFTGLRPGTYTTTETQPSAYLDGKDTVGSAGGSAAVNDVISGIVLNAGDNSVNNNFGELPPASLSGYVYEDVGNDGVRNAEPAIAGVTITLTGTNDLGQAVSLTTTTDANGYYEFTGLRPGTYTTTESQPAAYIDGKDTVGSAGGSAAVNDVISGIVLNAGDNSINNNFGELPPASVSGYVYQDVGNDGVRNAEPAIAGVTITLTGTNDLGQAVSVTTTTDANGYYEFTGLRPGTYTTTESQPAAYLDGKDTVGSAGGSAAVNDVISGIVLNAGDNSVNNNFGELPPASLSGYVYEDVGNDGVRNAEPAIAGVTITLTGTNDLGQAVSVTTTTDANGYYEFTGLRPGTYTTTESQPAAYLDGKDTVGSAGGSAAVNDVISGIVLNAGDNSVNNNFGELPPASVSGYVYQDVGNDGVRNAEPAIAGVTVTLTGTDDLGQAVSLTTTTDANGYYEFTGLRPGTYTTTESQPAAYLDGKDTVGSAGGSAAVNDVISGIVLNAGDNSVNNNFGELPPASLSGYVYEDVGNDGVRNAEPAIAGVTITLTGTNDLGQAVSLTTTTDANGYYEFTGLRPGTYTTTESQPAAYIDGKDTVGSAGGSAAVNDVISGIVLNAGDNSINNNFGELPPASLSGYVYEDIGNDGVRNAEPAIAGVTVTLNGTDDLGQAVSLTTTTDANGYYEFTGLRPGTYTTTETQPAAYLDGKDTVGSTGGSAAVNDVISGIVLNAGDNSVNNNFGELPPASLSGYVYEDVGNDGVRNAEPAIAGVTITLTGTNDLGQAVSVTTTTDANGYYEFTGLRPGTYTTTETQPSAYLDGKDTVGSTGGSAAVNDVISGIVLNAGENSVNNNFGELPASSVSGYVYQDAGNDGVRNAEPAIAGVTITLTGTNDLGQAVSLTTTTDANGYYEFTGLRPGTYTTTESQPAAYLDGKDTVGSAGGSAAVNDVISGIVLNAGDNSINNNFGELPPARLSGYVYEDVGNDGVRNAEPAIAGVTVTLTGTDDLGQAVSLTTTTDANGYYEFTGLRPGTYTTTESQPAAYLDGKDTVGSTGGSAAVNDVISGIVLNAGDNSVNNNFGELPPASVSGYVYQDVGNDGVRNAEPAIAGVTITLTGTNDLGQAVSVTTTTDANGYYEFTGLRPGTYTTTESQPAAYLDGKDTVGSAGGSAAVNDVISGIVLNAGDNSVNNNFGELPASSVSGYVYQDVGNDGVRNAEPAIAGVTITLTGTNDLGQAVSVTTTTDANGYYEFTGLRPGTYTTTESQPAAYLDGKDTVGSAGGSAAVNDVISGIVLAAGTNSTNNNFGELPASSVSGYVYQDVGNDGVRNAEPAIAGVTITLTGTNDLGQAVSVTTTTDANGYYEFTGLRPGTYTTTESQPAAYLDGKDTVGSAGGSAAVNDVISGIVLTAGTNSTNNNFGELPASSVSGYVYQDVGNDGVRNAEPAIAGVTITLTGTNDLGQAVSVTTTTNANGYYEFTGLRPGTYTTTETQPSAYLDGKDTVGSAGGSAAVNDVISGIVLAAGTNSVNNNFGELPSASVSGYVYQDVGNDGVRNAEPAIAGVTVKLTGTNDLGQAVSVTTTTDANGYYEFTGLRPGTYTTSETQPSAYLDGKDTVGSAGGSAAVNDVISGIVLAAGTNSTNNNFGELPPASVSGYVYQDVGNDGVRNAEPAIAGVTVKLTGTNDLGQAVSVTTTTDANGYYEFTGLRPGTYTTTESQPSAYLDGKDTVGSAGGSAAVNDVISGIVLAAGTNSTNNNFGELPASSVSGYVYQDAGNDGVRNAEPAIAGVTITLTGTNDLGQAVSVTTTTDANGYYEFTGLRPGTYTTTETQPSAYLDGKDTVGSAGGSAAVNDVISGIVLTAGTNSTNNNFGELPASSVSGYVYQDVGNDGVRNAEPAIAGVTITLTGTNDLGQAVSVTTTTNANGYYEFTGLRPGTYTTTETQPSAYLDGKDTVGSAGGSAAVNDVISNIVLNAGTNSVNNNFGELPPASVSGYVYQDVGNDGVRNAEPAIAGVTVKLTGTNDLGQAVSVTTTTNANGYYEFTGLRPGTYNTTETQPSAYLDGKDTVGSAGGSAATNDVISNIVLNAGTNSVNNNFGELPPASVSGYVYQDVGNDGVRNAEPAIAGVTVKLTGTNDLGQAVTVTTTTDANGYYNFANLRPGTYTVTETQPSAYLDGKDTVGSAGGSAATNDVISNIVLSAGTNSVNNNFGELQTASLGNRIWVDTNGNGQQDDGATGISGLTVTLIGGGADGIINGIGDTTATTSTGSDGAYLFTGLTPGMEYQVQFSKPTGYSYTTANVGSNDGNDSDANTSTGKSQIVVLGSGESNLTVDAGLICNPTTSIGDKVWEDMNANGIQDDGELGIQGITVKLLAADRTTVLKTTTTDAAGNYLFSNLAVGDYAIQVVKPTGYYFSLRDQGSNNNVDSDVSQSTGKTSVTTLSAGENDLSWDAGLYRKASVGDKVWDDMNHNNLQDNNEPGIANITVKLLSSTGTVLATTTTNASGNYLFANLNPGTYILQFDKTNVQHYNYGAWNNMSNWKWAVKDVGNNSNDSIDSDVTGNATSTTNVTVTSAFTLVSGQNDMTKDAGITPIVIDLNGDGINTIAREESSATFDLLGNGKAIKSGWLAGDDGFLAIDRNANGQIDDISELFGGLNQGDGFSKLASFDSNEDGLVDANDTDFASLKIWQDMNGNRETDEGELFSLEDAGIISLNVNFSALPYVDNQGNLLLERSIANLANGDTVEMTDVYFNVATADALAANVELTSIASLVGADPVWMV